jgi:peptidoglycan hydrolase-like protein with peptidoglycan-binding domain
MTSRRKLFAAIAGAIFIAVAAGWLAGSSIRSPAELAARTAPPDESVILVPVEERVLSSDIVTRGTARFGSPQQLFLAPSALKADAGIVARVPLPGTELREGDVVLTTSGRPVFVLAGERPAFRDLGPRLAGDDVNQLEAALARLGFDPGPQDGAYDNATEGAVAEWYRRAGFTAFEASTAQLEALRTLNADSNSAQLEFINAQDALSAAEAALVSARTANARAIQAAGDAQAAISTAVAIAGANNNAAAAEVAANQAALNQVVAAGGTPEEIASAQAELSLARANAEVTRATGDGDIAAARSAEKAASSDVTSTSNDIRAADAAVGNATAALAVRKRQADLASSELGRATAQAGVQVPADEVIFVASTPVRVSELIVIAGAPVSGALMTVTNAVVAVDGSLRLEEASLAKAGMAVEIDEPDLNINATGIISRVAESPGTNGVDGFHVYFEVLVDGSPPGLVGTSVRLTVPVESTGGAVLAVPVSAVTLSVDGSSRVQRQHNGALEFVTVDPGLSAEGYVEVRPIGGELKVGDLVVIGIDQPAGQPDTGSQDPASATAAPAETGPAGRATP